MMVEYLHASIALFAMFRALLHKANALLAEQIAGRLLLSFYKVIDAARLAIGSPAQQHESIRGIDV